jgi:hypothetical protein
VDATGTTAAEGLLDKILGDAPGPAPAAAAETNADGDEVQSIETTAAPTEAPAAGGEFYEYAAVDTEGASAAEAEGLRSPSSNKLLDEGPGAPGAVKHPARSSQ